MQFRHILFTALALSSSLMGWSQNTTGGYLTDPMQGKQANPTGNPDWSLLPKAKVKAPAARRTHRAPLAAAADMGLPDAVNNGATKYFRSPVVNQAGNSCGISSRIGHMLTYELNAYRDADGSLAENQLPPHFAFVPAYESVSKENYAKYVGCPDGITFGGTNYSSVYGGPYTETSNNYGRMQGYDKWYKAMLNRITDNPNFPVACTTETGARAWKCWLYNHNGDTSFKSGGVIGIGCAITGSDVADIGSTTANDAAGVTGMKYLTHFGTQVDHATIIVGYDDRIEFDLDGNGTYGESSNTLGQNETGAWIMANSWGTGYANNGFVYVPYALATSTSAETASGSGIYTASGSGWTGEIYKIRKDYTPQRTLKAAVSYSKRSEIQISVGIAQDITATTPEKTHVLVNHNYHGDYDGDGSDAEVPMLGKWSDGQLHTEAMEFGYDLTDFTNEFDKHRPLKYFLIIRSKSGASGSGMIEYASILDYEFNANGVETPFADKNVSIRNSGSTTTISVVVYGEELPAPTQLAVSSKTLSWTAPAASAYSVAKYNIYNNDELVGTTSSRSYTLSATPANGSSYTVRAVYTIGGKEVESSNSNAIATLTAYDSNAQSFTGGASFSIPGVCAEAYSGYTIEFDYLPTTTSGQQCCVTAPSLLAFVFNNRLYGGSSTSDYGSNIVTSMLTAGSWNHIAYVISGTTLTIYVNGSRKATRTNAVSGMGAGGSISFGGANGELNGRIDEIKIWSTARTATQISNFYKTPIGSPTTATNLLAYFKGDTFQGTDGVTYLRDCAHGHHAPIGGISTSATGITLNNSGAPTTKASATISVPSTLYVGVPATISATSHSDNAATWSWSCAGASVSGANANPATFTFNSAGTKTVSLTIGDVTGNSSYTNTLTKQVTVLAAPAATANFSLSSESTKGSDRISFLSQNQAQGCTYSWQMPGADEETATTRNTSASYSTTGEKSVTLTVTDAAGNTYTHTETFYVNAAAPKAFFEVTPNVAVVGKEVTLTDKSLYEPTSCMWRFDSDNNRIVYKGTNGTITPTKAGIYKLSFAASNDEGSGFAESERALIVCNSDSENGLTFSGNANVTTTLGSSLGKTWTIDYWFNPASLGASTHGITGSNTSTFQLVASESGALSLTVGGETVSTDDGFYTANEWHHYAITFSSGAVKFYCDGTLCKEGTISTTTFSSCFKKLQLGGSTAPMTGCIDEFRIWNKALTQAQLRSYCVAPTSSTITGLLLYWQMNQSSGNVTDVTKNNYTGTRNEFGPDGDAWTDSKGVFAIDFSSLTLPDVTSGRTKLSRANFNISAVSSEQDGNYEYAPIGKAFDGDETTFWHSQWEVNGNSVEAKFPHSFTIQRTVLDEIDAFEVVYRSGADSYRRAKNLRIEESADGINWQTVENNVRLYDVARPAVELQRPITKEFVRFTFPEPLYNDIEHVYLVVSEFNFFGTAASPDITPVSLSYVACSDEDTTESRLARHALDGDDSTFWSSNWSAGTTYPHTLTVQNTSLADINVIKLVQNHPNTQYQTPYYRAYRMNVETSSDNSTWTTACEGLRIPMGSTGYVRLPKTIQARYIRFTFTRNQSGDKKSVTGDSFVLNELSAYGADDGTAVNVNWIVTDNADNEIFSITTRHTIGSSVTSYPSELTAWMADYADRYVSLPSFSAFTPTTDLVKKIRYAWSGPFAISTPDDMHYYNVTVRNKYLYANPAQSGASPLTSALGAAANYAWAFMGNPFDGFTVVPYGNPDMNLSSANTASDGGIPQLSTDGAVWFAIKTNDTQFSMKQPDGNYYWNDYGNAGVLKNWTSSTDGGAQVIVAEADLSKVITDGYYRIRSAATGEDYYGNDRYGYTYLSVNEAGSAMRNSYQDADPADMANTIFRFEEQADGAFVISKNGYYIAAQDTQGNAVPATTTAANAKACPIAIVADGYTIQVGNSTSCYANINSYNTALNAWTASSSDMRSVWLIEQVADVSFATSAPSGVGEQYASLYLPFSYYVPDDAAAYAVHVDGNMAVALPLESGFVPEATPVILIGESSDGNFSLSSATGQESLSDSDNTLLANNELQGAFAAQTASGTQLLLNCPDNTPGFYTLTAGTTIPAYTAYLTTNAASVRSLVLTIGQPTDISAAGIRATDGTATYDLQGRRITARPLPAGIYIRGGKRIYVK